MNLFSIADYLTGLTLCCGCGGTHEGHNIKMGSLHGYGYILILLKYL